MNIEQHSQVAATCKPHLRVRLAYWLGIYFAAWLLLIWMWPGELYDWESTLTIPKGLVFLSSAYIGELVEQHLVISVYVACALCLVHLVL